MCCDLKMCDLVKTGIIILTLAGFCAASKLPACFVFGDSLLEVGNNNYIFSLSKSNQPPNGVDFGRPTGRFTNNRTVVDIVGQEIGLDEFIPPFLAPNTTGDVILRGVNYASGSAGILNCTGYILLKNINMEHQLDYFSKTRKDIISAIGTSAAKQLFNNAVFVVEMGMNDILNNYLVPVLSIPLQILLPPQKFISIMIKRFRSQITRLHSLGARKIIVTNVAPIGCIPFARDVNIVAAGSGCFEYANQIAQMYNSRLQSLIQELNRKLEGSTFVYVDLYNIVSDITKNAASYGFDNTDSACCSVAGKHGGLIPCSPPSKVCADRTKYLFWDPYHPTDAANVIIASYILDGSTEFIWPINGRQLLNLSVN